jgi:hypothetical protein
MLLITTRLHGCTAAFSQATRSIRKTGRRYKDNIVLTFHQVPAMFNCRFQAYS